MAIQAELNILGMMINDRDCLYEAVYEIDESFFTSHDRMELFSKIRELSDQNNISRSLLEKRLTAPKQRKLIASADSTFVNSDSFDLDLSDIKNDYISKELGRTLTKAQNAVTNKTDPKQVISMIENEISALYFDDEGENIIDPKVEAPKALEDFYEGLENPESNYGLRFSLENAGFPSLDQAFMGAQGGDLFLLAAKTGKGKTALAITLSRIFSIYQQYTGYYVNAEMKKRELLSRLLSPVAKVTAKELYSKQLEGTGFERQEKVKRIANAFEIYRQSNLYLSHIPVLTMQKAKGLSRQVRNRYQGLNFLVIDYIGRMEMDYASGVQEWQVLYEITKQSKALAMQMNIPVFILAQRNHDGNIEGAKKMANECDGVLYFEPTSESDYDNICQTYLDPKKRDAVNYKLIKKKIRRDDNPFPIYCGFDKKHQIVNEIT